MIKNELCIEGMSMFICPEEWGFSPGLHKFTVNKQWLLQINEILVLKKIPEETMQHPKISNKSKVLKNMISEGSLIRH